MPARFVTNSLVTKRAGIAARFVTLVTKRAATVCFTPDPRFLQSQFLFRLYKIPTKKSHTHVKGHVVHARVRWVIETPK